jgi:hypothetical protein
MAKRLNVPVEKVKKRVKQLHEMNPMLGHRGCRLSVTYPELIVMQTTAIIEAACNVARSARSRCCPKSWFRWWAARPSWTTARRSSAHRGRHHQEPASPR